MNNPIDTLRTAMLAHGQQMNRLPEPTGAPTVTALGAGGVILNPAGAKALVNLFSGNDELVPVDRDWLHCQLKRLGIEEGDIDLLLSNIRVPIRSGTPELKIISG